MRLSRALFQTLRDTPRDADALSQQLMLRTGMIRKHAAGIYSYLPLLVRSFHKLTQIVREELDGIGWQEVIMPMVVPAELWKESGRWYAYGREMLRVRDRKDNEFCLGPTHEEVAVDNVRGQVSSYKQLPLAIFQMTDKFRDEIRPRFGLMRGREFVMMDGYSFHADMNDVDRHYEEVGAAYERIFNRAGLRFCRVEADTGAIGGTGSHEYHVLAETGEDAIFICEGCGYAANLEKAETASPERQATAGVKNWGTVTSAALEKVSTPTQKTIEDVSALLQVPATRNVKTLAYRYSVSVGGDAKEWRPVVAFIAGDRQLNEVKLKSALTRRGLAPLDLAPLPEDEVARLFGCAVGSLGPVPRAGASSIFADASGAAGAAAAGNSAGGVGSAGPAGAGVPVFFDREVAAMHDAVCGANEPAFHLRHLEPARDIAALSSARSSAPASQPLEDLVNVVKGEPCPRCATGVYAEYRGIEVGHIFKLGDKYSKPMNAIFQNEAKETKVMQMGTYGIGITRVIAAAIEQNFDADGIIWPEPLAPFSVHLINLGGAKDPDVTACAEDLYRELRARGVDVVFDDRDLSPGVKFKDADLVGVPRRVTVGKKGLELGQLEFSFRRDKVKRSVALRGRDAEGLRATVDEILAMRP